MIFVFKDKSNRSFMNFQIKSIVIYCEIWLRQKQKKSKKKKKQREMLMLLKLSQREPSPMTMIFSQRPSSKKLASSWDLLKKSWLWKAQLKVLTSQMKLPEEETSYLKKWNRLLLKFSRIKSHLSRPGLVSNKLNTLKKRKESSKLMRRTKPACYQLVHFRKMKSKATWLTSKKKLMRSNQPMTTTPLCCKDARTSTTELILAQIIQ